MSSGITRRMLLSALGAGGALVSCTRTERTEPESRPAAPERTQAALRVEVWHDTVCPWCRIGCYNLGAVLDAWKGPPVEVVFHPFLLNPDMPPEGVDMREHLASKFGNASLDQIFARLRATADRYGAPFNFDKVRIMPATVGSHALLAWAPADRKRQVLEKIHHAYFMEGANLGDVAVLGEIASAAGLEAAAAQAAVSDPARLAQVREEARSATTAGIDGVPHFRIGARQLQGAQAPEALRAALEALAHG